MVVCEGVANIFPFVFEDLGLFDAKNILQPEYIHRVRRVDAIATDAHDVSAPEFRLHRARRS